MGKRALRAAFEAFPLEEPIFFFALGAKVFVKASLTLWSFAFWGKYVCIYCFVVVVVYLLENESFGRIQCIVGYWYKYTRATYDRSRLGHVLQLLHPP